METPADTVTPSKVQKLSAPDEPSSEGDRAFDTETQKSLEEIDACQSEIDALNEKASEEILTVEQKYNQLRKPHFEKRNGLISKIQNFWVTVFSNHPQMSAILSEEEGECLHYLTKLEVEEFEDIKSGYNIKFHFKSNPFFTNDVLCKEFHLASSGEPESKSSPVTWKEGMDLTAGYAVNTDPDSKDRKRKRPASRTFFKWYMDNQDPSADDIAEVIKDDMWTNPLQYYLAAADVDGEENGISDEDGEEDFLGEGDEEGLDDVEEEDEGEEGLDPEDDEGLDDDDEEEEGGGGDEA